jgi:hypothetical protein
MGVASIITDYTGRLKDISILQYPDASKIEAQTVLPKFGKIPRFCAGVQKLVQRYTIMLLTNINSQVKYPDFGTSFLYTLQGGTDPTDSLLASQIFAEANYITVKTLLFYQTQKDSPADERIVKATLENISLMGGYVSFDVSLTTEAEDVIDFVVPLPK